MATGCALHDAQNGMKWGMLHWAPPGLVDDLHIVVEALRNGSAFIHAHIGQFLVKCIRFSKEAVDEEATAEFWTLLGVEATMLEEVVAINPVWFEGYRFVRDALRKDPQGLGRVATLIVYMLKWEKCTDSRWVTIGSAARQLLRSLAVGLESLVALTRDDRLVSDFHLHGFDKLSSDIKMYVACVAVGSYPMEAFMLESLEDDRLVRRLPEVKALLGDEMAYLHRLGEATWQRLATALGLEDGPWVRSATLNVAHTSLAYLTRSVLSVAEERPFNLAVGDASSNLAALHAEDPSQIVDPTTLKIHRLLALGVQRQAVAGRGDVVGRGALVHQVGRAEPWQHSLHPPPPPGVRH